MSSFRSVLLFAISSVLLSGAVQAAAPKPAQPQIKIVTDQDNEGSVTLHAGGTLIVRLKANATTGYRWNAVTDPALPLKLVGDPQYIRDKHPVGVVGAGGTEEFHFAVLGSVSFDRAGYLRMLSLRPWEAGVKDARLWEIKVNMTASK